MKKLSPTNLNVTFIGCFVCTHVGKNERQRDLITWIRSWQKENENGECVYPKAISFNLVSFPFWENQKYKHKQFLPILTNAFRRLCLFLGQYRWHGIMVYMSMGKSLLYHYDGYGYSVLSLSCICEEFSKGYHFRLKSLCIHVRLPVYVCYTHNFHIWIF